MTPSSAPKLILNLLDEAPLPASGACPDGIGAPGGREDDQARSEAGRVTGGTDTAPDEGGTPQEGSPGADIPRNGDDTSGIGRPDNRPRQRGRARDHRSPEPGRFDTVFENLSKVLGWAAIFCGLYMMFILLAPSGVPGSPAYTSWVRHLNSGMTVLIAALFGAAFTLAGLCARGIRNGLASLLFGLAILCGVWVNFMLSTAKAAWPALAAELHEAWDREKIAELDRIERYQQMKSATGAEGVDCVFLSSELVAAAGERRAAFQTLYKQLRCSQELLVQKSLEAADRSAAVQPTASQSAPKAVTEP